MKKIGLFYGSDTGVTDDITRDFVTFWEDDNLEVMEIGDASVDDFNEYDTLILGLSTWYDGDLQSDWEDFFDDFQTIDFTDKTVAIYGLGDQIGYAEYFIDGVGILAKVIIEKGGTVVGYWPTEGYRHTDSVALIEDNEDMFYGLALDHDNESQLTDERLKAWIIQIKKEFNQVLQEA
ncbi:flavodoxin [Neotamlana laminarinivorans]|uniref:Flavodoxin n=1 Tax=Neotamlana laminarinivorans TaxID=2883124 RepID=A0A9X1I0S0_9FLAO|nr:flavodoxin [Tamlana laminarinivorans]MCB4799116.1 flavodoxin [Tamlana laminarinivorans]